MLNQHVLNGEKHSVLIRTNAADIVIAKCFSLLEDLWVSKKCIDLSFLLNKKQIHVFILCWLVDSIYLGGIFQHLKQIKIHESFLLKGTNFHRYNS